MRKDREAPERPDVWQAAVRESGEDGNLCYGLTLYPLKPTGAV